MFSFHSVYGLCLRSNLPIPGLTSIPHTINIDVTVWLGLMPPWLDQVLETARVWSVGPNLDEHDNPTRMVWQLEDGEYFRYLYSDGTEFVIERTGTQVWARWPDSLTLEDTVTYLLGPVLGFVLLLRGVICLHASAIAVGDGAIVMLGSAGAGKSTTAAMFARLGYPILSEDVVPLSDQGNRFLIQPGYPLIRLWPASVHALCGAGDALPLLTPNWDKRYLDLAEGNHQFQQQPLPLTAVYILDERRADTSAPYVEAVPASTGLINLVANTYVTYMKDSAMRGQEFEVLGRVAASVPLRKVIPHADIAHLPKLCEAIIDDFHALPCHSK